MYHMIGAPVLIDEYDRDQPVTLRYARYARYEYVRHTRVASRDNCNQEWPAAVLLFQTAAVLCCRPVVARAHAILRIMSTVMLTYINAQRCGFEAQ